MADRKWRKCRLGAVLFAILIQVINGYEEIYTISQLSPKSIIAEDAPLELRLETSHTENLAFNLEPSALFNDDIIDEERTLEDIIDDEENNEKHVIVARSADPIDRGVRSINIDEIPTSNNNEIDNDLEMHNKRKYYEIRPTRTSDFMRHREEMLASEGFGDRLSFQFPGEERRVPRARALQPQGPLIHATAVQPIFATATHKEQGRQNSAEIQNIITGIVKLLNGNVNVAANSQLLRPVRPMNSRINNRGPPRISEAPQIPPDFPPVTAYVPTKTPPPYPFDRPHHGINIPEQIVPPINTTPYRPGYHRPNLPPWHRPRPRPTPSRRPNPNLPTYRPMHKPIKIPTVDLSSEKPDDDDEEDDEDILTLNENVSNHSENHLHIDEEEMVTITNLEVNTEEVVTEKDDVKTTTNSPTKEITTSTTTTTEKTTRTEKEVTTTEKTTTSTTTEKIKEKPLKVEKKKETEKDKQKDKHKQEDKNQTRTESTTEVLEASISEKPTTMSIAAPTPTDGLPTHAPAVNEQGNVSGVQASSINSQPLPSSNIPYKYHRPRPGIVLDDPDFKKSRPPHREAPVITVDTLPERYGEIFDVTVSAIQGPGGKGGASVHIEHVNPQDPDDIIVSPSGDQGFVSIDGKRTYLNLFGDASTVAENISPSAVQRPTHSVPPSQQIGTGIAIPADDEPSHPPLRRPGHNPPRQPSQGGHPGQGVHPGHGGPSHGGPSQGVPSQEGASRVGQPPSQPGEGRPGYRRPQPTVRIDTCIVGDDSTCDQAQNEKCRTEGGISSCQCRPGFARRVHRDPCRRVVALVLNLRVDRLYDRKIVWDAKLGDKESDPYQQLSYEALRAIDSAFSMTPFSDDFVGGTVNSVHRGDQHNQGVFVNYTILMQETAETARGAVSTDIQRHLLGVIRRRSNNVGASALWVDTPAGAVIAPGDLDECASVELNDCHKLATCMNTWGGFRCACPDTTRDLYAGELHRGGRDCRGCANSHCNDRGSCHYAKNQPYCSCNSGYYGSTCEVDGEVVGVAVGASLAAALVIALTLAALLSWSRKWSREQKAAGMGSPVFSYMAANTIKAPPVGQPPYQVTLEERMRWAQIAEAMAANHYAQAEQVQTMVTRPSSAMFGAYPTLPPVPLPRTGLYVGSGHHNGTLNTVASRANTAASHHNLYGYTNHGATESTSSEASSHVQERADLLVPRPKSRARSMHNQTGIYYDVEYENAPEAIYGTKGIPLSTYTMSRGPPFYRQ